MFFSHTAIHREDRKPAPNY